MKSVQKLILVTIAISSSIAQWSCSKIDQKLGNSADEEQKPTGGEGSGSHGGDELKHLFTEAKLSAISKLRSTATLVFPPDLLQDRISWFRQHRDDLLIDLETAPHIWHREEADYCAQTMPVRQAAIHLSMPTCRQRVWTLDAAIRILIHEATHHMGVTSEEEADELAIAFAKASPQTGIGFWEGWQRDGVPDIAKATGTEQTYVGGNLILLSAESNRCGDLASTATYNIWDSKWNTMSTVATMTSRSGAATIPLGRHNKLWRWGGHCTNGAGITLLNDGTIYDPQTGTWESITTLGAPSPRDLPLTAYLNDQVFVWGGTANGSQLNDGAIYSIGEKKWVAVSRESSPPSLAEGGYSIASIETSTEAVTRNRIVLYYMDQTGIISAHFYSLQEHRWLAVRSSPAPIDLGDREKHMLWANSELFVFIPELISDASGKTVAGLVWNPTRNEWRTISSAGAPASRTRTSIVWTGARYINSMQDELTADFMMFGGIDSLTAEVLADGAVYSPTKNSWQKINPIGAPVARYDAFAAWTGARLLIWGGRNRYIEKIPVGGILTP